MIPNASVSPLLIRTIVFIYLVLFLSALLISCYLLNNTIALHPIPMVGLLKYLLLCVLFVVLLMNAVKAFSLQIYHLQRLADSTVNLKWLFVITTVIAVAAKFGCFNQTGAQPIVVTYFQLGLLTVLTVFCFWSDSIWKEVLPNAQDDDESKI